jgi:hypothetical protein
MLYPTLSLEKNEESTDVTASTFSLSFLSSSSFGDSVGSDPFVLESPTDDRISDSPELLE